MGEQAGRKATRVKERSPSLVSLLLLHSARLKQSGSEKKKKERKKKKHTTTKMISSTKLAGGRKGLHLRVASRRPKGLVRADRSALRQRDARRNAPTWIAKAQNEEEFDLIDKLQKLWEGDTKEKVMKHVGMAAGFISETASKAFEEISKQLSEDGGPSQGDSSSTTEVQQEIAPPAKLPQGVSTPSQIPRIPTLTFGFTSRAERWNSRAAMVGFFSLLFVELIAGKGLLELLGFNVGNGLGFEF